MFDSDESKENKRPLDDTDTDSTETNYSDSESFVRLSLAVDSRKKRKLLPGEKISLKSLPCAESYEMSYMHRDTVTHCIVSGDFIITASCNGLIKFWKKIETGIEFVKHFQSHLGPIVGIASNSEGTLLCSASLDKSLVIFDVIKSDTINTLKLDYIPSTVEWIHGTGDPIHSLAVSDKESPRIHIYDGKSDGTRLKVLDKMHRHPVTLIKYNPKYDVAISADKKGKLEYWSGSKQNYIFPRNVGFTSKKQHTDLFEFAKRRTFPCGLAFSPDGKKFATVSPDRRVRVFHFYSGKLIRVFDEKMSLFIRRQHKAQDLPNIEFCKRMAVEMDLEETDNFELCNIVFDKSGNFIMYATILGIKLINIRRNRCVRTIGKNENLRMLNIALYQGFDPTLICTAHKSPRFFLFSRRAGDESSGERNVTVLSEPSTESNSAAQRLYHVVLPSCAYS